MATLGCIPLGWSGSGSMIQDLSNQWCNKGTDESKIRVDHSCTFNTLLSQWFWFTDPDPGNAKGLHPCFPAHFVCSWPIRDVKFTMWTCLFIIEATGNSRFGRYAQLRKITIFGHWRFVAWKEEAVKLLSFNKCMCGVSILQPNRQCRHKHYYKNMFCNT